MVFGFCVCGGVCLFVFPMQVVCKLWSPKGTAALKITQDARTGLGRSLSAPSPEASPELLPLEEKFAL